MKDAEQEQNAKALDWALIKRLLNYFAPYKGWVLFAIFILIIARALEAWVPLQMGALVQHILLPEAKPDLFSSVLTTSLYIVLWISLSYILDTANIYIRSWVGQQALFTMRLQVYDHIQHLPLSFYDHYAIGRLMTRTIHDIDQINQLFTESLVPLIGSLFLFVCILVGIFILDWRVALALSLVLPVMWWLTRYFRQNQRRSYEAIRMLVGTLNAFVQEHLMGVSIIRTFQLQQPEKKRFDQLNQEHYKANLDTVHYFAFFFAGIEFLQNIALIAVFVILVAFSAQEGGFQAGTFFTVSLYSLMVFRPLADLAERYNVLQSAMAAAERIFEILDTPVEPVGPSPGLPLDHIESIVFDDVWFAYEKDNWVFKGLSFTINAGESVALVGVTGAGKTSVINILLRFYEFQRGHIYINGKDIHAYAVSSLRQQFSIILQDPVIFSGTISDNIALYNPTITQDQIQASADYVHLTSFLAKRHEGLQHMLKERGTSLSVGEMQLIAFARAVAQQRSMLILDEATSNIDVHTERIIQKALQNILTGRTALVIAHRLSTIQEVTRIVVIDQGRVVERGSHQQLIDAKGVYEKLYRLQFSFPHH